MNDNVRAWIDALRSGNYRQGAFRLRSVDNRFCCLGVACDLAVKAGVIPEPRTRTGPVGGYIYTWRDEKGFEHEEESGLPDPVSKWLGISGSGVLKSDDQVGDVHSLIGLNDALKFSFEQIADVIEHDQLEEWPQP